MMSAISPSYTLSAMQLRGKRNIMEIRGYYKGATLGSIVFGWLEGGHLGHWLRLEVKNERYTEMSVRHLMNDILTGLQYLHEK